MRGQTEPRNLDLCFFFQFWCSFESTLFCFFCPFSLLRPESKRLSGPRFYPVKAVPVDLFPSTRHCELVILFEREQENVGTAISVMCN